MQPEFVSGSLFLEVAWAAGILLVSVLAAWFVLLGMRGFRRRLEKRLKKTALVPPFIGSLSKPIFLIIIFEGLLLALSSLSYTESWRDILGKAGIAGLIVIITYGLARSEGVVLDWYLRRARVRQSLIRLIRRITVLLIYVVGVLVLLDYFNISITPMVAGLGIGGLAVALALQPTLSNFFAGTQIVIDHVVRVGDYIELDNGVRGYVSDIGWRSTRIRTAYNNMVIVPNSRLADSVITNYYGPTMELAVIVESGVSYESDLEQVEKVVLEVAKEVINDLDEAVKTFEPWFGYEEFGDSNINFWIWLQAKDRLASFRVKSELIKRIKSRFDREGITINYPVRRLTYDTPNDSKPPFPGNRPES